MGLTREKSGMETFGEFVLAMIMGGVAFGVLLPLMVLINGWVLKHLWEWLVIPCFPIVPHLGVVQCGGLVLVWHFMCPTKIGYEWADKEKGITLKTKVSAVNFITWLLAPFFTLLISYIIHLFM